MSGTHKYSTISFRISPRERQEIEAKKLELMGGLMSRSTLANIEAGRRNIKASDLKALKILFDVDYEEFFRD